MPSELDEPQFTVELELTGETFTFENGIESYSMNSSFMVPTDGWEFVIYNDRDPASLRRKFRPLQPVRLYIDGQQQVVGRIDRISGFGESGKALKVQGRDYLADVCDGTVDPSLKFNKGVDLGDAVLQILRPWGITTLFGSNLTRNVLTGKSRFSGQSAGRDFKSFKLEDLTSGDNKGAYELVAEIAARHGYMLQPAGRRSEAALVAPDYAQQPGYELTRTLDGPSNILPGAQCTRDYSKVPTVTLARGRQGASGEKASSIRQEYSTFGPNAPSKIGQNAEVRRIVHSPDGSKPSVIEFRWEPKHGVDGNAGLLYRPMFYTDKKSQNQEQLDRGMRRMIAERLMPTLEYRCTVRGHRDRKTGALYAVDTIAHVLDEIEDLDEGLWAYDRTFSNDGRGPTTELVLCRPESFQI